MHIVAFGLAVSSSWGNGHATLWRALGRALRNLGHRLTFFERDVPYYAAHRDRDEDLGCDLRLYGSWEEVRSAAEAAVRSCDAALVTSYCPDGPAASDVVLSSKAVRAFYDLDTPVTLSRLAHGERVPYLPEHRAPADRPHACLADFDLVLSFTGGPSLEALRTQLGARRVAALYGSVDPDRHRPVARDPSLDASLSYMGTFAADRAAAFESLFIEPARRLPSEPFLLAGSMYPSTGGWPSNVVHLEHLAPQRHPAFFSSSTLTLNLTRGAMAQYGYCPSGRLFEAAACGAPLVSDVWEGLELFFTPDREIILAHDAADVVAALRGERGDLNRMAARARARVLDEHSAKVRAQTLVRLLEDHASPVRPGPSESTRAPVRPAAGEAAEA